MKKYSLVLVLVLNILYLIQAQQDSNATSTNINATTTSSDKDEETYYNATELASYEIEAKTRKEPARHKGPGNRQGALTALSALGAAQGLMSTATGVLAAVGGGYLMYALMTTVFQNVVDPAFNRQYGHLFAPLEVPPLSVQNAQAAAAAAQQGGRPGAPQQPPFRRNGVSFGLPNIDRIISSLRSTDYPEATFKYLQVDNFNCRKRVVCELEQLLSKTGMPKVVLQSISNKIPGMEKYEDAVWWALQKNTCKALQVHCPLSLGQTLLKSIGLS